MADPISAPLDLWWAVPGVLAGMSMPFVHPERHDTPGAVRDAFADELPALWDAGVRAIVCLLNMPSAAPTYSAAGFDFHLMPIADGDAPTLDQVWEFLRLLARRRWLMPSRCIVRPESVALERSSRRI